MQDDAALQSPPPPSPPPPLSMANYPCDFIPHLPPGAGFIPSNGLRLQRGYAMVGGSLPVACEAWAIVIVEPEPHLDQFQGTSALISDFLEQHRGFTVREISRCGLGSALVRFLDVIERDSLLLLVHTLLVIRC